MGMEFVCFIALDPLFGPICLQSFSSFDAEDAICFSLFCLLWNVDAAA